MSPATHTRRPATGSRPDARAAAASRTGWLAWSLAGLSFAMFVSSVALFVLTRSAPGSGRDIGGIDDLLIFVPFLAFPLVGALIASRRPGNPIGWICLADGMLWMLIFLIERYVAHGLAGPGSVPFLVTTVALNQWLWVPAVGLFSTYLILLFPDGRLLSRRWRPLAWLSGTLILLLSASIVLAPEPLTELEGVSNPFGLEGQPWITGASTVMVFLLPLCILAAAFSLVLRFRRSGGEVRQQIKWIAFAASFVSLAYLGILFISFVIAPESSRTADAQPLWLAIGQYATLSSFAGVPVAIGFAVMKYRLYDIEVIINRALVYGSLTATLALVYLGGVAATQTMFRFLTGQEQQPQLAVVVSTLAIAALFNPLRRRVQAFVDRRFYRQKYDAAKTLEAFSATLRDETDLDSLSGDLVSVVRSTVQPEHVSLWLREPGNER